MLDALIFSITNVVSLPYVFLLVSVYYLISVSQLNFYNIAPINSACVERADHRADRAESGEPTRLGQLYPEGVIADLCPYLTLITLPRLLLCTRELNWSWSWRLTRR